MLIHLLQPNIHWQDKRLNFHAVANLLNVAQLKPHSLLLLPEMFATGFSMNTHAIAEPTDGPTQKVLADLARRLHITIVAGIAHQNSPTEKPTNRALILSPTGALTATYDKLHPFSFSTENQHYSPGKTLVTVPHPSGFTLAPTICYDLRFPELYRHLTKKGANLILVLANWPTQRESHWLALLQARAIENQSYIAAVNRVGTDPQNTYTGHSQIIDPTGKILTDAGATECIASAEIHLQPLLDYRKSFPALSDLRDDLLPD
jgi:predicted amidohydrolase